MNEADPITLELDREGTAERTCDELPEALYHARPEWSVSQFKILPEEPEMFWGRHLAQLPDWQVKETPSMVMGSAIHAFVLQRRNLNIIPREVLSSSGSKAGKEWKEFEAAHVGEAWLKESDAEPALSTLKAIREHPKANELLGQKGLAEHSIFWVDELTGLRLRGRLDFYIPNLGNGIIVDLKCTTAAMPDTFPWKCYDLRYHVQAATYLYGATQVFGKTPDAFVFITAEVEPPYRCRVYQTHHDMIDLGWTTMKENLLDLKERLQKNDWNSRGHNCILKLDLPKKAYQQFKEI